MKQEHEALLTRYLELPKRLEEAIAGLTEKQLDLSMGTGWSIRAYVHHTVEGELLWEVFLRAIAGRDGIEIPIQWYLGLPQDEWAKRWAYDKRRIEPTLALFRGSTAALVELLKILPAEAWEHAGRVTWPNASEETRLTVREIVLMHLRHMDGHTQDIQAIRKLHGC
jgi:hypothetical protein